MPKVRAWLVHIPQEFAGDVDKKSAVFVGGGDKGDLKQYKSLAQLRNRYKELDPNLSDRRIIVWAGNLWMFSNDMQMADYVLTTIKSTRMVFFGKINSDYSYDPSLISSAYPNVRLVKWEKKVSRDDLSQPFKNTIGSLRAVCNVDNLLPEIEAILSMGKNIKPIEPPEGEISYHEEVQSKADEMISDILSNMDPYEFQYLVANLLKAMGFNVKVGPAGADGGVDILAYPDAFGFKSPRIKVQVKLRKGSAGAPEIQQLAGAAQPDESMFVSIGGFTQQAQNESKKHSKLVLIDLDRFVELLLEYYEKLEPEYRTLIPLKKIYVPTITV